MNQYDNWWEEKRAAYLYAMLAEHEKNPLHQKMFHELNIAAESQAQIWQNKISGDAPTFKPDCRTLFIVYLIKWLGAERIPSILSAMKVRGMAVFTRCHSEHKHLASKSASNLRAAVFGINDGLISNMSLILGVTGAAAHSSMIMVAGISGLLAGAFSMAAGEYVSVRSQREVFEYQIAIEKQELEEYPEEEMEELSLIYQARGVPKDQADALSQLMIQNPETGLNTLAREELGLNPEDLVSPIGAMISSFFSFALGAFIPLLPFLFFASDWNLTLSMAFTGIALFSVGAALSLFTNKNFFISGIRMLLIGAFAGSVTFMIGKMLVS